MFVFRKEKEEEQRKEAELRMLQHWKINNPQIRQVIQLVLNKYRSLAVALIVDSDHKRFYFLLNNIFK